MLQDQIAFSPLSRRLVKANFASTPGVVLRDLNGVKTTVHTSVVDGVEWQVIKENDVITSSFPTGGKPIIPE